MKQFEAFYQPCMRIVLIGSLVFVIAVCKNPKKIFSSDKKSVFLTLILCTTPFVYVLYLKKVFIQTQSVTLFTNRQNRMLRSLVRNSKFRSFNKSTGHRSELVISGNRKNSLYHFFVLFCAVEQ